MKQSDYWKNRFTQLEDAQNSKALDYYSTLEDEFSRAARNVDKELAAWYTRFAKNENISYEEAKQVLTKGELSAFKMSVEDYIKKGKTLPYSDQWAKELERASAKFHVTRLEAIQLQMQQQIEVMYGYELDTFDKFIANQYKAGYYKTMFEFQKGFGVGFDVMKLDDNKIAKLIAKPWAPDGQNFSSRIWRDKNKLMAEMPSILTQATIRGDGYAKTTKLLADRFNVSKSQAKNLVITESAFFSSASQTDCFNDLGVKQYEIVATLDSKTSSICRMMDGKVFDMKDRKPGVTCSPFHGRCRTTSAPYFNDEFELNTKRAARDPVTGKTYQVPADMKYPAWEKSFVNGGSKDGLDVLNGGIIKKTELSKAAKEIADDCDANSVEYKQVERLNGELMPDEIIFKLAGGDTTKGSCSSLAFAYAGNKSGIDVVDFRGGSSRDAFAKMKNIKKMLEIPGIKGSITKAKREIKETAALLKTLELNKEYYLAVGKHAAIVRRLESGVEYLELQSKNQNGWIPFKNKRYGTVENTLGKRFGCRKTVDKSYGLVWEKDIVLMDVDSFSGNSDVEYLLGYINTAIDSQKKGVGGDVK
jgi:SPP1 gp7 family putative phage head morphogenesis protein